MSWARTVGRFCRLFVDAANQHLHLLGRAMFPVAGELEIVHASCWSFGGEISCFTVVSPEISDAY